MKKHTHTSVQLCDEDGEMTKDINRYKTGDN